ncbi:putative sulfate/molybdate transporter [Desulfogranum japonicum]|uniref:putative sulfate/molybdate transporter n=1 Tax=Desulfogranum japonicum TaxID=231447 RepID=UPI0004245DAF|nr:putative sulfate/molybdate transporter [Desulfogranum japonicum]
MQVGRYRFDRMELAGSLGDLGTLLPIALAMVQVNGMSPVGIFFSIGLYYILAGFYFGITVPVQPMKVVGAYAVATSVSGTQIGAAGLCIALFLLLIAVTGAIDLIRKYTPASVIRGVQLSTGILLMVSGLRFILGTSRLQELLEAVEPHLVLQRIGPVPVSLIIGSTGIVLTFFLLKSRRMPAAIAVLGFGIITGLVLGGIASLYKLAPGVFLPQLLPLSFPSPADFMFALPVLVLPQLPMTLGNAVMAYTDLSRQYFGSEANRVTNRAVCLSMAIANLLSFLVGGMPLCHGAGGLAAHYRFGARTAGSNLIIGVVFLLLVICFGTQITLFLDLIPLSILGVLLLFAGSHLAVSIMDLEERKDYVVVVTMLSITLVLNLAIAFLVGLLLAHLFERKEFSA